ncbi:toll/interleukin-1 receptor domain-containing protein [Pseudomonas helleri]|uniref:toll/interleukin-1 receptor domain-containing protein n=1 Tax=Pseudomonas helleri TaxID=1608996 RepID=UPI003FCF8D29
MPASSDESTPINLFISYSHDNAAHKAWVEYLATRLTQDGIHVILDQWDLPFGGDLPRFMHTMASADMVIAVCTPSYVQKASSGKGGVGYESMILTAQMMRDVNIERIIPLVRVTSEEFDTVPVFLSSKLYVDFRGDGDFENRYGDLLRDIYGQRTKLRPRRGKNPFPNETVPVAMLSTPLGGEGLVVLPSVVDVSGGGSKLLSGLTGHASASMSGKVAFDYSDNDGQFLCGAGEKAFHTRWGRAGNTSIHVYKNPPSVVAIALAGGVHDFSDLRDVEGLNYSSRYRSPMLGEIVIMRNEAGYYLATKIERVQSRGHGSPVDELVFSYAISSHPTPAFSWLS